MSASLIDSLVLAELDGGNYRLDVTGDVGSMSQFRLNVFLVGAVDGDHKVDRNDLNTIRCSYGARIGDNRYLTEADANRDGRITAIDLSLARMNEVYGRSSTSRARATAPLADTSSDDPTAAGGVYDRVTAVTPREGYEQNAPMQFFESTKGWVQPLSSTLSPEGGVWQAPGNPGDTVTLIVDWYYREAGYGNTLVCYQVDDLDGTIDEIEASSSNQYKSAAAGNTLASLASESCYAKEYPDDPVRYTPPSSPAIFQIDGGSYYSFYVVQGKYTVTYPEDPVPGQAPNYWPYYWFAISGANLDGYAHFQGSDGSYYVEDLAQGRPNPAGFAYETDFDDVMFTVTTLSVDIDTDSDNDGDVDHSEHEEEIEDVDGSGVDEVGKRIFVNKDDDNKNGKPDLQDTHRSDYTSASATDNDLAAIALAIEGFDMSEMDGYELWLSCPDKMRLYASSDKLGLIRDLADPEDNGQRDYTIPTSQMEVGGGVWYKWELGSAITLPDMVYAEGRDVGSYHFQWRLVQSSTEAIFARDTVEINVEEIVYPFMTQDYQNWEERPTTDWVGLEVADAWYIDKALIDYITTPGDKGHLETIHPDYDPTEAGGPLIWASAEGPDSTTTESYTNGFTMEFDYSFETSRGDGTYGYVKIDPEKDGTPREKLSFVGNSGVKFGGVEAAILDVTSMVGLGGKEEEGPLDAFDPSQGGYVQSNGDIDTDGQYETEPLNRLMTGIEYESDYDNMKDFQDVDPNNPPTAQDFYDTLENNYGRTNGHMEISWNASTYMLSIYLDNEAQASYSEYLVLSVGTLELQSHWGSGVIFSNMDITPYSPE